MSRIGVCFHGTPPLREWTCLAAVLLLLFWSPGARAQTTNLGNAIYEKDMASVRKILASGVDLDADIPGYGLTPLQQAVNDDWGDVIGVLVQSGADPNLPDDRRRTPLIEAAAAGREKAARALLDAGADPNRADRRRRTALDIAYQFEHTGIVRMLVDGGAVLDRAGPDGDPLLLRAVSDERWDVMELLLEAGASPNVQDALGTTPLMAAAGKGDAELVTRLLRADADPNAVNAMGFTARQMAEIEEMKGNAGAAQALAAAGAQDASLESRSRGEAAAAMRENLARIAEERRAEDEVSRPEASEIPGEGSYPTGRYTGPCYYDGEKGAAVDGAEGHVRFATTIFLSGHADESEWLDSPIIGDLLESMRGGTMTSGLDLASAFSLFGSSTTVAPPDCDGVTLGPGEYTQLVNYVESRWVWKEPEWGCRPGVYCSLHSETLPGYPKARRSYTYFTLGPGTAVTDPEEPCETVEKVLPTEPDLGQGGPYVVFDLHAPRSAADTARLESLFVESSKSAGIAAPADIPVELSWTIPPFMGVSPRQTDLDPYRSRVAYSYALDRMPETNDAWHTASMRVDVRALRPCLDPRPRQDSLSFLFSRDGTGNPSGGDPNWFYYWMQTDAAGGLQPGSDVRYAGRCNDGGTLGFFNFLTDRRRVYLCDGVQESNANAITGVTTYGIDNVAVTLLHEWQHKTNWEQWWQEFWDGCAGCTIYGPEWAARDADFDWVPDELEGTLGYGFVVGNPDTHNTKLKGGDEHYVAVKAEERWRIGSADRQDWAFPGARSR